jgi:hypothetical protein
VLEFPSGKVFGETLKLAEAYKRMGESHNGSVAMSRASRMLNHLRLGGTNIRHSIAALKL